MPAHLAQTNECAPSNSISFAWSWWQTSELMALNGSTAKENILLTLIKNSEKIPIVQINISSVKSICFPLLNSYRVKLKKLKFLIQAKHIIFADRKLLPLFLTFQYRDSSQLVLACCEVLPN